MHHRHTTVLEFLPRICDVILADYDVGPSCRFSHAKAQILKHVLVVFLAYTLQKIDWVGVVLRILCRINMISVITQLESRRYSISEIRVAKQGSDPRTLCSASQERNHHTTAAPLICRRNLFCVQHHATNFTVKVKVSEVVCQLSSRIFVMYGILVG